MRILANTYLLLLSAGLCLINNAYEKDIILEFKAAYFQPINYTFRHIYGGGAIFGPEITFNIFGPVYGFGSYDFLIKNGKSFDLKNFTKVRLHVLAIGLKLMGYVSDHVSLYAGLGFEPILVQTRDCSPYVVPKMHRWSFGGIAKFGTYIDLPHDIVLDFFVDYSFTRVKRTDRTSYPIGYIQQTKADLSGFNFGGGIGYRFN